MNQFEMIQPTCLAVSVGNDADENVIIEQAPSWDENQATTIIVAREFVPKLAAAILKAAGLGFLHMHYWAGSGYADYDPRSDGFPHPDWLDEPDQSLADRSDEHASGRCPGRATDFEPFGAGEAHEAPALSDGQERPKDPTGADRARRYRENKKRKEQQQNVTKTVTDESADRDVTRDDADRDGVTERINETLPLVAAE